MSSNSKRSIDFSALEAAFKTFQEAMVTPPNSELEQDGIIQRFEYTYELCHKSIRKLFLHEGRSEVSSSPKPLFRLAAQDHLLENIEQWLGYVDARNRTSHTYNRKTASEVFSDIQSFEKDASYLIEKLNERIRNR